MHALGGDFEISWNRSLLTNLGLEISAPLARKEVTATGFDRFALSESSELSVVTQGASVQTLSAGTIAIKGGYQLTTPKGNISLENFTLRRRPGATAEFDLVTAYGETPFYVDNLLIEPGADGQSISVRTMDLRISPSLAARLDKPEVRGWLVATLRLTAHIVAGTSAVLKEACPISSRWPGMSVPGHTGQHYVADIFMQSFAVQLTGCQDCTGPGGHGRIKLTPTTILRNNVNDGTFEPTVAGDAHGTSSVAYAADIPWRNMFSGDCPPYGNDQHPYLTWALYRINAAGQLEQVGRAGIKHAHTAQNGECVDNPSSNHILGRGCGDVYGAGDNDAADALGPRSEIIPATGQWGRCGSIYDPQCTGKLSGFAGSDPWKYRLAIPESEIDGTREPGARYIFEAWYVVRDDVDPYNSMAHVPLEFSWYATNRLWIVKPTGGVKLGSVIDQWVNPEQPGEDADNEEIRTPNGRIKVAVRATPLGTGRFRYDYAVMNFDFAQTQTSGREPNLRIISTHGINSFSVSVASHDKLSHLSFAGATEDSNNDWLPTIKAGQITWVGPEQNELTWGSLFRFSFESDQPPASTSVHLYTEGKATHPLLEAKLFTREQRAKQ